MKNHMHFFGTILLSLVLTSPLFASDGDTVITKSFPVARGGSLELSTTSGDVSITAWDNEEVHVKVIGIEEDSTDLTMTRSGETVRVQFQGANQYPSDLRFEINVPARFNIDVETSGGDIDIQGSLSGTLKGSTSGGDIRIGNLGGTITMTTSGGDIEAGKIEGQLSVATSGGDIRIGTVTGEANVKTAGGDITMESVGKRLKAQTAGGNISIGDVGGDATVSTAGGNIGVGKVSGSASLSTSGGDVSLSSASGMVKARTAGGDLQLENITGSVEGSTAAGNVVVHLIPGKNGKSTLSTAIGDIKLLVPENAKATINARIRIRGGWQSASSEFGIQSDFKTDKYEKDERKHEIRATLNLNGGGEMITLETSRGNIEIRKALK